jgi:hypothetical protein
MKRREFLKVAAGLFGSLVASPAQVFSPPRECFLSLDHKGLMGLYSHLGVLPATRELSICEGRLLDIDGWDGTGYPCLVENACTFGPEPPRVWVHDFDLWNFRHDDPHQPIWKRPDFKGVSHWLWHAKRRFGAAYNQVIEAGGGWLSRELESSQDAKRTK